MLILIWLALWSKNNEGISVTVTTTVCLDSGLCRTPDFEAGVYCWHWEDIPESLSCLSVRGTNFAMSGEDWLELIENTEGLEIRRRGKQSPPKGQ